MPRMARRKDHLPGKKLGRAKEKFAHSVVAIKARRRAPALLGIGLTSEIQVIMGIALAILKLAFLGEGHLQLLARRALLDFPLVAERRKGCANFQVIARR